MIEYTVIVKGTCLSEAHDYLKHVCKLTFKFEYLVFAKGESFGNDIEYNSYMFKVCCGMRDIKNLINSNGIQVFKNL